MLRKHLSNKRENERKAREERVGKHICASQRDLPGALVRVGELRERELSSDLCEENKEEKERFK